MVGDVDNGGGCIYVETGAIWEISETSAPFHCEAKTTWQTDFFYCMFSLTFKNVRFLKPYK